MRILVLQCYRWAIWRQRSGQDLIEYALLAALIAVSAVAIMPGFAVQISRAFSRAGSVLTKANGS